MSIELKIKNFLEQKKPEILENHSLLRNQNLEFIFELANIIQSQIYGIEDKKITQIVIECLTIIQKIKKNKISFVKNKELILKNNSIWTNEEELNLIEKNFFDPKKMIIQTENNEDLIFDKILEIRENELESFLKIQPDLNIKINKKFIISNPFISTLLKKLALDQISFFMFKKMNSDSSRLFSLSKVDQNHPLNQEFKINKKDVIFCYINMQEMDQPKIQRSGSVFDSYEIKSHPVKQIFHKMIDVKIPVSFKGFNLNIEVPVWTGTIVCEDV